MILETVFSRHHSSQYIINSLFVRSYLCLPLLLVLNGMLITCSVFCVLFCFVAVSDPCVSQPKHPGRMQPVSRRDAGVWHQTRSLLYKNLLIKWRTKQQSLQVLFMCHSHAFFLLLVHYYLLHY